MFSLANQISFVLVIICLIFLLYLFAMIRRMKDKQQIHYALMTLMVTILIWAAGAILLEYNYLMKRQTNRWLVSFAYTGLILTPVAILYLGLIFAKTKIRLSGSHSLFLIVPIVSLVLVYTNEYHHLFYRIIDYEQMTQAGSFGPYFIFHSLYSYFCIVIGMWYLIYFSIKNAGFFSRQSILILAGIVVSLIFNGLITFQVINVRFHTNVISFVFSFLFFYLAIIKYDFLSVVPIALQKVVDHISDSFLVISKDDVIIDYNQTFVETFKNQIKINRKDSLNYHVIQMEYNPLVHELLQCIQDAIKQREQVIFEQNLELNGKICYFTIEVTPLYNQGIYLSTVVLLKDITQVRNALETIQHKNEILAEQERLVSLGQLIGGIAHNLKTPIMSIAGGMEGLLDLIDEYDNSIDDPSVTGQDHHEIAAEMKQWVNKIKPHCTYMSDIITAVKGQASQFSSSSSMTFTLGELIKRVQLMMLHELKRYHCVLNILYDENHLIEFQGDISSLVQIFDNLIMNAINAYDGKSGVIDLTVHENKTSVLFVLKDWGGGIPEAIRDKLFREMVTTKGKNGTGLGLYMSYATVRGRFNGNMWFETKEGEGTTFYVSIPIAQSGNIKQPALSAESLQRTSQTETRQLSGGVL
jgi:signal transduction histidine kinase